MKCLCCSYEQDEDFKEVTFTIPIHENPNKNVGLYPFPAIYICPYCGTLKAKSCFIEDGD